MSATMDAGKFSRYYAVPIKGHNINAPVVSVGDWSSFTTNIYYVDQLVPIFKDKVGKCSG